MSWLKRLLRGPEAPVLGASGPVGVPPAPGTGAPAATGAGAPRPSPAATGPGAGTHSPVPGLTGAALRARAAAFPQTSFREGYDIDQVDAYVAQLAAVLDGSSPPVTADEVLHARFGYTKFRAGYDQDAVDDLLDEVATTLRRG